MLLRRSTATSLLAFVEKKILTRNLHKSSGSSSEFVVSQDISTIIEDNDWNNALPYNRIPGPRPVPIFGNRWRALPFIGNYDIYHVDVACQNLYDYYGSIVRIAKFFNHGDMVMVFDANDIEKLYRAEEYHPDRPQFDTLLYYKEVLRKDFFGENLGVIGVDLDNWRKFRPKIQKEMLQPKIAKLYINDIEETTKKFVERVDFIKSDKNEVPGNFLEEIAKWALECLTNITLDTRLGCLDEHPPKEAMEFLKTVRTIMTCMTILEIKIPFWQLFNTPMWRKYVNALDTFQSIINGHVNDAILRGVGDKPMEKWSLLQRMLASNTNDIGVVSVMAFDMFLAGIDTSSNAVASVLYSLAKHQEIQEKVYDEITNVLSDANTPLTAAKLDSMHYLKASIKEVLRLAPPLIGNGRRLSQNIVLQGYQVPKGTYVVYQSLLSSRSEKHYKDSENFIPDRWIKSEKRCPYSKDMSENHHPFSNIPFGFGTRMCLGKRFADLLMQIVICKLIQKYRVEYDHGELSYTTVPLYSLQGPLKFKFTERI